MDLFIGTSGWAYREWKPAFYPADVPAKDFLRHYATRFGVCEVNGTYYRIPTAETVAEWAAATPSTFRFVIKANRGMTSGDVRWTSGTARLRDRLLAALEPLGARVAAITLRYPDALARDDDALQTVLTGWSADLPPLVFDFRDATWFAPDVMTTISDHGHTIAVNETHGESPDVVSPGPLAYLRLRAPHYADAARQALIDHVHTLAANRPTYVIGRHDGIPAGDPHAGVGLAEWLVQQTEGLPA